MLTYNLNIKQYMIRNQCYSFINNESLGDLESTFYSNLNYNSNMIVSSISRMNHYFNFDLMQDWFLNNSFTELNNYDTFLYCGLNLRYEASALNIKITQLNDEKQLNIFHLGVYNDMYYKIQHTGNHNKEWISLLEGKHYSSKGLRTKNSIKILNGISFLRNKKSLTYLGTQLFTMSGFISNSIGFLSYIYLGHFKKYSMWNTILQNNFSNYFDNIINIDSDESNFNVNAINLSSHRSKKNYLNQLNKLTLYESGGISLNIEGRLQQITKSTSYIYTEFVQEKDFYFNKFFFTWENLLLQYPVGLFKHNKFFSFISKDLFNLEHILFNFLDESLNLINMFYFEKRLNVQSKTFIYLNTYRTLYYSYIPYIYFNETINNYYLTDHLSKNSSTMLNCSFFQYTNLNFYA